MDFRGMGVPSVELLEAELEKELEKSDRRRMIKSGIAFLLVTAAGAVLIVVLLLPLLQIKGTSMAMTLDNGDVAVAVNDSRYKNGDVVAFNYDNSILVKRVIGLPGDWIDIDGDGNVYVNDQLLEEPYVYEKDLGRCNIDLPCQVPADAIFVLGDHRKVSIDSRNTEVGFVKEDAVVGEVLLRVWPLNKIGFIK